MAVADAFSPATMSSHRCSPPPTRWLALFLRHPRLALLPLLLLGLLGCRGQSRYLEPMFAPALKDEARLDAPAGSDPRPVVLVGSETPLLEQAAPGNIVAFAFRGGVFEPVPVQVDERFRYDLATVYTGMEPRDCPRRAWCRDLDGQVEILGYADPTTHVGPDPDPAFDADDEVALMVADFGERTDAHPPGVDPETATEVAAETGGERRFAYLYVRTDPALDPAAGRRYVR